MKLILLCIIYCVSAYAYSQDVELFGSPSSIISSGAVIPEGKKMLWTSGTTAGLADTVAKAGTPERFGNTKTQALNILDRLEKTLESKGLSMKNVLMLRVYIAPDKWQDGLYDYKGWNEAYAQYFNNKENPVKPIRSTIGIAGLVSPDKFIEIELVAVFP